MIKVENGNLTIEGEFTQIIAELTFFLHEFRQLVPDYIDMDKWLERANKMSKMSAEEVHSESEKTMEKIKSKIKSCSTCSFDDGVPVKLSDKEKELLKKMFGE